jgi:hypothetical protein
MNKIGTCGRSTWEREQPVQVMDQGCSRNCHEARGQEQVIEGIPQAAEPEEVKVLNFSLSANDLIGCCVEHSAWVQVKEVTQEAEKAQSVWGMEER